MKTISDDLKFFIENSKKSRICASCHFEFHQIVEVFTYEPTQALIAFFETPLDKAYEMGGI